MSDLLARALEKTRPFIEEAIVDAGRELEACRARCEELETMIARARAFLSGGEIEAERLDVNRARLFLHEAMLKVLHDAPGSVMRAPVLASEINRRNLYLQRDGRPVTAHQVHARVYHYPHLFQRTAGGIRARV
jgi:hypothetical protein